MSILFTADWQTEFDNIDLCEQAAKDVRNLCMEYDLSAVVIAGDLKRAYNPVDVRVINFWTDFISTLVSNNCDVILVLGNHDRVGMYSEAHNWFPTLAKAGANVVWQKPELFKFRDTGVVACLPFSSSIEKTKLWARQLSTWMKDYDTKNNVLVFHNDLQGCAYNVLGTKSTAKLRPADLHPDSYDYCFGGHIHLPHLVTGNVYYLGSPFASDWGEANQKKGFTIVKDGKREFIESTIPRWYDPTWPGFPKSERFPNGTRIRIHVPLTVGQTYSTVLDKAREVAERKYPGASIYTVPEFKEEKKVDIVVKADDTDSNKIAAYVEETLSEELRRKHEGAIIKYLSYKLKKASESLGMRAAGRIQFLSAKAKRFLSYPELEFDFSEPRLVLITGENKDWPGRSNGVGKTSFLQPVPVALFGKTFKDQKHDGWACDKLKGKAYVSLRFRDGHNRHIRVYRSRRPGKLMLFINGKDKSSGMQSTAKNGTQGLVEKISGFTWQTLANAVYIDQEQVNTFLAGTQTEQKKVLERFQNLERFTAALQLVVKDNKANETALMDARDELRCAEIQVKTYIEVLNNEFKDTRAKEKHNAALSELSLVIVKVKKAKKVYKQFKVVAKKKLARVEKLLNDQNKEYGKLQTRVAATAARQHSLRENIRKAEGVSAEPECPTCLQVVDKKHLQKHIDEWNKLYKEFGSQLTVDKAMLTATDTTISKLTARQEDLEGELNLLKSEWLELKDVVEDCQIKIGNTKQDVKHHEDKKKELGRKLAKAKRLVVLWQKQIKFLEDQKMFTEYCIEAFSRNGIPAFLNAQLCPQLNKAAEEYSEVFADGEIQIRFSVEEGEFGVEIINAHGGKTITDQSAGEKKMAAIIASFALRAIAPPSNLLVLDEPGDGLDATNAKAFAVGLKKMKDKLGTVLLTTHNPYIVSELSGEESIIIEKRGGLSKVIEN